MAAYPGCVLEEFVRWNSPRDLIDETVEDENEGVNVEDDPKIPVLIQVIEQACLKASQVARSPQQDAKGYESKFTFDLLERPDASQELEHFVATMLQNSEVSVRGGPMGPAGNVISKPFQAAQRASYMILDKVKQKQKCRTKMNPDSLALFQISQNHQQGNTFYGQLYQDQLLIPNSYHRDCFVQLKKMNLEQQELFLMILSFSKV